MIHTKFFYVKGCAGIAFLSHDAVYRFLMDILPSESGYKAFLDVVDNTDVIELPIDEISRFGINKIIS